MITRAFPHREAIKMLFSRRFVPARIYKRRELKKILKIASCNPFYKKHYEGIDLNKITPETISELPYVTKDILMDNFEDWINDDDVHLDELVEFAGNPDNYNKAYHNKYHVCSSSGTSKRVFYSLEGQKDFERETLMGTFAGVPTPHGRVRTALGKRPAILIIPMAAPYSFSMCCEYFLDFTDNKDTKCIDVCTPIEEIVEELNKSDPYVLAGYILSLLELADEAEKGNLKIRPYVIFTTGDTYKKDQRRRIETIFNCRSVGIYASTECGIMAQAGHASFYDVNHEIIIEPVDENDNPIEEGEISDHIFVTCLWRKDFPIIRYRLDDKCVLVESGAKMKLLPAGRDTPRIIVEQNGKTAKINGYGILNITEELGTKVNSQMVIDRYCNIGINVSGAPEDCERYIEEAENRVRQYIIEKYDVIPNFYRLDGPFEKQKSGKYAELIYKE